MNIAFKCNGKERKVDVEPTTRLLDMLREVLGLTGTKEGCSEGECGACTVLIDGEPANSCLVMAGQVTGQSVTTIEGMGAVKKLHVIQEKLIEKGGTQCGICTPGIALTALAIQESEPKATRERIRELLAGNICRCTGYQLIVDALEEAFRERSH